MKAVLQSPLGKKVLDQDLFTIGSSPDNSLIIDNIKISAHHAEIRSDEQGFSIADLGSIHGTYVNGERLDFNMPRLLSPGNSIAFGETIFTYEIDGASQTEEVVTTSPVHEGASESLSDEKVPTYIDNKSEPSESQESVDANTQYTLPQQYQPSNEQQTNAIPIIPADYKGPIPGYVSIEQMRRRERGFILIGLGLFIVLALAVGSYILLNRSTPEKTLDTFCNAIQGQDYQTAYNQLASSLQSSVTELEFAHTSRAAGKVSTCTHDSVQTTNNRAIAHMTFVNGAGQRSTNSVALTSEGGNSWKMSMFPTTPSITLTAFCNALQNKDYSTAYSQLSVGIRRSHAESQFETDFAGLTCSYSSVSTTGNSATTTVTFKNAAGQIANSKVTLIQDNNSSNNWKINSVQF